MPGPKKILMYNFVVFCGFLFKPKNKRIRSRSQKLALVVGHIFLLDVDKDIKDICD